MPKLLSCVPPDGSPLNQEYQAYLARERELRDAETAVPAPAALAPAEQQDRSRNPLRPHRLAEVVGQAQAKELITAALRRARTRAEPLPHMLLVGPAGTGKSTLAHVVASELGVHVYQLAAPVSHETLLELREVMRDRDVLFIDELHMQAVQERRGKDSATSPEALYGVLEDRVIATAHGVLPFPAITMIGGTTDEGMLSDAFLSRFPLRPRLTEYTIADLVEIATRNAKTLGATLTPDGGRLLAVASRGTPREVNNLVRNAVVFSRTINERVAREVLRVNAIEEKDGLTADMAALLKFVALSGRRETRDGVRYQCSVATIATGIGKSRDTRSIVLRIEPYLIRLGYLAITHGGRQLTERGVARAAELVNPQKASTASFETPAARALRRMSEPTGA